MSEKRQKANLPAVLFGQKNVKKVGYIDDYIFACEIEGEDHIIYSKPRKPKYHLVIIVIEGYLNMVIELKALDGQHNIGFVDTTPKGMEGKEITFYHHSNDDVESYRQKLYSSIPLTPIALQKDDTLRFVINTYDEGIICQEFIIQ